jgi:transposase
MHRKHIKKLRTLLNDPGVDIWAIDEVHFQQHGSRCRMWIPSENKDPILQHHPTRKSVWFFGALRLRDGVLVMQQETDSFNAQTFLDYLILLEERSRVEGRRIVVIIDNAKYHHAKLHKEWREKHQDKFTLLFLPPYSPQLNPIERVWKLTRRLCLHNRYFKTLNEVLASVGKQFEMWSKPNIQLLKLCAIT